MGTQFIQLEQRMTIKLGTLMVVAVGIVATLVKLLQFGQLNGLKAAHVVDVMDMAFQPLWRCIRGLESELWMILIALFYAKPS